MTKVCRMINSNKIHASLFVIKLNNKRWNVLSKQTLRAKLFFSSFPSSPIIRITPRGVEPPTLEREFLTLKGVVILGTRTGRCRKESFAKRNKSD